MRGPGMRAALREVLAAHHDEPGARMARDEVIEILARIGLVAHQEVRIGEPEILDEQGVARQFGLAPVLDRQPPQPDVDLGVQRQRDAESDAALLPSQTKRSSATPMRAERLGAGAGQDRRLRAAEPKEVARSRRRSANRTPG